MDCSPPRLLCPWGFSRQEYWSRLPWPPPGDLPNPGTEPRSPALQADSLLSEPQGSFILVWQDCHNEIPRLGGLHSKHWLVHSSGGRKSKIEVSASWVSSEASLLRMQTAELLFSYLFTQPLPCAGTSGAPLCVQIASSCKDTSQTGLGPTPTVSFYCNHLFKGLSSTFWGSRG